MEHLPTPVVSAGLSARSMDAHAPLRADPAYPDRCVLHMVIGVRGQGQVKKHTAPL